MPTSPPVVDVLPDGPSFTALATFRADAVELFQSFPDFRTQLIALGDNVYNNALEAYNSAALAGGHVTTTTEQVALATAAVDDAQDYATMAAALANFVGNWADQSGAAEPPYSVANDDALWALLAPVADVTASEPTEINPDWFLLTLDTVDVPLGAAVAVGANPIVTPSGFVKHTDTIALLSSAYPQLSGLYATAPTLAASLISANPESGGKFGWSVAVSDSYIAVGAYDEDAGAAGSGRVYVFDKNDGSLLQTLTSPNAETSGWFGYALSLTDTYFAIGAHKEDGSALTNSGRAYVYSNSGGTFGSPQTFNSPNAETGRAFGWSVSITDNYFAVGAPQEDGAATTASGRVYVYSNSGGTFGSPQTLESPNAEANAAFGYAVALTDSDTYLAIGAYQENGSAVSDSGRVYVYTNSGGTFGSAQTLESPNAESSGKFGNALAVCDEYLAVGAAAEDASAIAGSGRVYVYANSGGTFGSPQTLASLNAEANGAYGYAVAITDMHLLVAAQAEDNGGNTATGRVYVYSNSGGTFGSAQTLTSSNASAGGRFGSAVALTDTSIMIGAQGEDGGVSDAGRAYHYDLADPSYYFAPIDGAQYTLTRVA